MHRDKFPEKIPFRLTRMLIKAMEISGVEGTFRIACENTLRVLRENRDSVMAILEAFVYDPLISWRLFGASTTGASVGKSGVIPKSLISSCTGQGMATYLKTMSASFVDLGGPKVRPHGHDKDNAEDEDTMEDPENVSIKENLNTKALSIISRVSNKLSGRDFKTKDPLKPAAQVEKLTEEAVSLENLCQCYIGWCPFW